MPEEAHNTIFGRTTDDVGELRSSLDQWLQSEPAPGVTVAIDAICTSIGDTNSTMDIAYDILDVVLAHQRLCAYGDPTTVRWVTLEEGNRRTRTGLRLTFKLNDPAAFCDEFCAVTGHLNQEDDGSWSDWIDERCELESRLTTDPPKVPHWLIDEFWGNLLSGIGDLEEGQIEYLRTLQPSWFPGQWILSAASNLLGHSLYVSDRAWAIPAGTDVASVWEAYFGERLEPADALLPAIRLQSPDGADCVFHEKAVSGWPLFAEQAKHLFSSVREQPDPWGSWHHSSRQILLSASGWIVLQPDLEWDFVFFGAERADEASTLPQGF